MCRISCGVLNYSLHEKGEVAQDQNIYRFMGIRKELDLLIKGLEVKRLKDQQEGQ